MRSLLKTMRLLPCVLLCCGFWWSGDKKLTEGTEAKFSADGRRIVFQRDIDARTSHIGIYDLEEGEVEWIRNGEGVACHPAWGPKDSVVYTYGNEKLTGFAARAEKATTGYNLRIWRNGRERALTKRRELDYAVSYSPVTGRLYFNSTDFPRRNSKGREMYDRVGIFSMELKDGAEPVLVRLSDNGNSGSVSPSLSPDGRTFVWAERYGFWKIWQIAVAPVDRPDALTVLTPLTMAAYAPAWSPDGRTIAFTACGPDDDGWYVYLMDADGGNMTRLVKGRNPSFAPDGKSLVYDDGKSIYRRKLR